MSSQKYGGNIYGNIVKEILSKEFNVENKIVKAKYFKWRYLKPFEWVFNFIRLRGQSDLWVRDSFISVAAFSLAKVQGKRLALIYHIDNSVFPLILRPFFFLIEKIFYYNLKKTDIIVIISEYWRKHFLERGYTNVYKICNGFNLSDFEISNEEVEEFKKQNELTSKPIIYIGNCQKAKGVAEIWRDLKDLDVFLVTSGEKMVDIPVKNLDLKYKDYLRLIKASSLVIEMHKFKTGWSRIAHESMLLKKPVIGSGLGGTRELLEGGGQIICEDLKGLKEKVKSLLNDPKKREEMGESGYNYAKDFTQERFKREWLELINKII